MAKFSTPVSEEKKISTRKRNRGQLAYFKGSFAETTVAEVYMARGAILLETRWRGKSGEIDLIFVDGDIYVFCEVKAAVTHEAAKCRLLPTQMKRIHGSASEYLSFTPKGQLSDVRFDLALVDATGEVQILENAFGHF